MKITHAKLSSPSGTRQATSDRLRRIGKSERIMTITVAVPNDGTEQDIGSAASREHSNTLDSLATFPAELPVRQAAAQTGGTDADIAGCFLAEQMRGAV